MDNPIPHGPEGLHCPLTLSNPLGPTKMSKVCHKCPLWMHIRGVDKNTGREVDRWWCGLAQFPTMAVEVANEVRNAAAETHALREEQEQQHARAMEAAAAQHEEIKKYAGAQLFRQNKIIDALTTTAATPLLEHKEPSDENR